MTQRPLVAVIDDDPSVCRALKRLLETAGMDAQTWQSGAKFLSAHLTREPDCLVLDIRMPEMSGPELRESLRSAGRAIPTVFITAHSEAEDALEGNGLEVLRKPFGDQALLGAISRAMARNGVT